MALGLFYSELSAKAILSKASGVANFPYESISQALFDAESGDVVFVNGNIVDEKIILKDGVNINFNGFSLSNTNGQELFIDNGVKVNAKVIGLGRIYSQNTKANRPLIVLSGGSTVYFDLEECVSSGSKIVDTNNGDTVYFTAKTINQGGGTDAGMFVADKHSLIVVRNADIVTEGIGFIANGRAEAGTPARLVIENCTFQSKYGAFVQFTSNAEVIVADTRVQCDGVRAIVIMGGGVKKITLKNTDIISTQTNLNATYNAANEPVFYSVVNDGDIRFIGTNTIKAAGTSKPIGGPCTVKVLGKLYVNLVNDAGVVASLEPITVNAGI